MAYRIDRSAAPPFVTDGGGFGAGWLTTIRQAVQVAQQQAAAAVAAAASIPPSSSYDEAMRRWTGGTTRYRAGEIPPQDLDLFRQAVISIHDSPPQRPATDAEYSPGIDLVVAQPEKAPGVPYWWTLLLRRTAGERATDKADWLARFGNPMNVLWRLPVVMQRQWEAGIVGLAIKVGTAGIATAAAAVTGGLSVVASEATGVGRNVVGLAPTIRGIEIGAAVGAAVGGLSALKGLGGGGDGGGTAAPTAAAGPATGVAAAPATSGGLSKGATALLGAGVGFLAGGPIGAALGGGAGLLLGKKK